ncbi:MAG: peptidoglycan DD-metalloendopeptidase family protein [Chlorobi bacterium]|nr:peptidoglycan DD-metalloendopeptidase family protein [Chlorobiota bacterium]
MKTSIKKGDFITSILNSYSQIFFSDNKIFAGILLIVSFFDIWAGVSGLLAISVTNLLGYGMGYSPLAIKKGSYGFNSLLVGLGTGLLFQPGIELFIVVFFASIITFFIGIALEGVFTKYGLPVLSIPFLFGMWIITLASLDFGTLGLSERGIYKANELFLIGGKNLVDVYDWWNEIELFYSLKVYFLSLGAIFFQFNILAGILISIGLLFYSRIAFTLSLLGFYTAYYFYHFIGADITELSYNYIGFNFILTSIALGGFYIIPSKYSYLWVVLLLPVVVLITISASKIFVPYNITIYSLPFNIVVLMFLYSLKLRVTKSEKLTEVLVQQNSPERNLYFFKNANERFKELKYFPVSLPFYGEWTVSQGHDGEYTHQGNWGHAWDFVIEDENKKQFKGNGDIVTDYYCYEKKVLAPADGLIQEIADGIEDNVVGDVNTNQNWGNSIVIKHTEHLYSQLSHLKPGSLKVGKGDFVKKGQVLAVVGNSGRSPYPHLHFQLQATPYVGSETLDYPLSHYILKSNNDFTLRSFKKPEKGDVISNIVVNQLLKNALHFIPGQKLSFKHEIKGETVELNWIVKTDIYNNSYIHCAESNSFAYFYNDGNIHYFKNFIGDKNSQLFNFYLAIFKVQNGYYKDLKIHDNIPVNHTFKGLPLFWQDFLAPFYFFLSSKFQVQYGEPDDELSPTSIQLRSKVENYSFKKRLKTMGFSIDIDKKGIRKLSFTENGKFKAECTRN